MKKNELKENKVKTHTEAIKNEEGKAVGHKTTAKAEGKNWKAEATHAKAEEKGYKMESYSQSYSYSSNGKDDLEEVYDEDDFDCDCG